MVLHCQYEGCIDFVHCREMYWVVDLQRPIDLKVGGCKRSKKMHPYGAISIGSVKISTSLCFPYAFIIGSQRFPFSSKLESIGCLYIDSLEDKWSDSNFEEDGGRVDVDLEGEGIDRPLWLALPTVPEKKLWTLSTKVVIYTIVALHCSCIS